MIEAILGTAAVLLTVFLVVFFVLACKYGWVVEKKEKEKKFDLDDLRELEEQQLNDALNNRF